MERQRRSMSNSSEGVRWSLDSIELEQPSLRLIAPGDENLEEESHSTNGSGTIEQASSDTSMQDSGDIDHSANHKGGRANTETNLHSPVQSQLIRRSILFEWWEELLSVVIAVVCTALSVAILAYMDDRPLDDWNLPLQPNTLIALLATLTRAALIFPLAECLGYLKWRHFEQPGSLAHLQAFDAASRGPLGAVKYLWALPIQSPLATSAAIIMTLLLLFQPFAQQTINFASRIAPMSNETAHVFQATYWNMSQIDYRSAPEEPFLPALSYGLYQTIYGKDTDKSNRGHCSTPLCEFPNYNTLAICSTCEERPLSGSLDRLFEYCYWENRTSRGSKISDKASYNTSQNIMKIMPEQIRKRIRREPFVMSVKCGFFSMSGSWLPVISLIIENFENSSAHTQGFTTFGLDLFKNSEAQSKLSLSTANDDDGVWGNVNLISESRIGPDSMLDPMKNTTILYGCDHELNPRRGNTIMNSTCLSLNTDIKLWFNGSALSDQFGFINGTETRCSLAPCIQRIVEAKLQNNRYTARTYRSDTRWHYSNRTEVNPEDEHDQFYRPGTFCSGVDEQCLYHWEPAALRFLGLYINSTIDTETFYKMHVAQMGISGSNYSLFFQRVAAQVSAVLQSPSNPNTMNLTGVAYGTEIYVQVLWMWITLPLFLLYSSLLILALSIWDSSSKNYIFKNSFLAAIAFQLCGWEPHEYGIDETWTRQSMRNVEKKAERMVARMQLPQDGDGGLRLKKE